MIHAFVINFAVKSTHAVSPGIWTHFANSACHVDNRFYVDISTIDCDRHFYSEFCYISLSYINHETKNFQILTLMKTKMNLHKLCKILKRTLILMIKKSCQITCLLHEGSTHSIHRLLFVNKISNFFETLFQEATFVGYVRLDFYTFSTHIFGSKYH